MPTPAPVALERAMHIGQASLVSVPARNDALFEVMYTKPLQYYKGGNNLHVQQPCLRPGVAKTLSEDLLTSLQAPGQQ